MIQAPLACTVRGCARRLARHDRTFACANGHSYDVARAGYVNLLQPQDRKSREAGDRKAAVEARAALESAGVGRALVDDIVRRVTDLGLPDEAVVVDLGCGTGRALDAVAAVPAITARSVEISRLRPSNAPRAGSRRSSGSSPTPTGGCRC